MPGPTPYLYRPDDDPVSLASQFQTTPQQLLAANPGGFPFSTGQRINIPSYIYQAPSFQQAPAAQPPPAGYGPNFGMPSPARALPGQPRTFAQVQQGMGQTQSQILTNQQALKRTQTLISAGQDPTSVPQWMLSSLGATPQSMKKGGYSQQKDGTWTRSGGGGTPGEGQFYGYQRNPETGRDERVIKNSSESNFLNEKRWDPKKKKYISIRQWLRGGRRGGRGDGGGGRRQKKQEHAMANTIIDFGISAG